jgi:hypothetical protein
MPLLFRGETGDCLDCANAQNHYRKPRAMPLREMPVGHKRWNAVRQDSFIRPLGSRRKIHSLVVCCVEVHHFCGIDSVPRKDDDSPSYCPGQGKVRFER